MMKRIKHGILMLALFGLWACQDSRGEKAESINFGAIPSGSAALVYIAQDRGFFSANGLSVNVKDCPTGVATIEALLKGDVENQF